MLCAGSAEGGKLSAGDSGAITSAWMACTSRVACFAWICERVEDRLLELRSMIVMLGLLLLGSAGDGKVA